MTPTLLNCLWLDWKSPDGNEISGTGFTSVRERYLRVWRLVIFVLVRFLIRPGVVRVLVAL